MSVFVARQGSGASGQELDLANPENAGWIKVGDFIPPPTGWRAVFPSYDVLAKASEILIVADTVESVTFGYIRPSAESGISASFYDLITASFNADLPDQLYGCVIPIASKTLAFNSGKPNQPIAFTALALFPSSGSAGQAYLNTVFKFSAGSTYGEFKITYSSPLRPKAMYIR